MLSFKVTITNNYNQEFVATVYIDIPLEDKASDTTIYDGKVIKEIKNTNLVKFVRGKIKGAKSDNKRSHKYK